MSKYNDLKLEIDKLETANLELQNNIEAKCIEFENLKQERETIYQEYNDKLDIISGEYNNLFLKRNDIQNTINNYTKILNLEDIEKLKGKYIITKFSKDRLCILKIYEVTSTIESLIMNNFGIYEIHSHYLKLDYSNTHLNIYCKKNDKWWGFDDDWAQRFKPIYELSENQFRTLVLKLQENVINCNEDDTQVTPLIDILSDIGINVNDFNLKTIEAEAFNCDFNC